jgi:large subunit ribosomal protein L32
MPVPKKRLSKSKKNSRKSQWYKIAVNTAKKALSQAKSVLNGKQTSFILPKKIDQDSQQDNQTET